jgi:hypothetical protein
MSKEYPVFVYKDKGPHQRAGGTYDHKIVETEQEFEASLADGWFPTLPEAIEGKLVAQEGTLGLTNSDDQGQDQTKDNEPPTRAELEAKAVELGIKFTDKTSDKKLGDLIAATLEA